MERRNFCLLVLLTKEPNALAYKKSGKNAGFGMWMYFLNSHCGLLYTVLGLAHTWFGVTTLLHGLSQPQAAIRLSLHDCETHSSFPELLNMLYEGKATFPGRELMVIISVDRKYNMYHQCKLT